MAHPFDEATAVEAIGEGGQRVFRATTHPAYDNMVSPYGGITAATVVRTLIDDPQVLGEPLALTLNYLAPIAEGSWDLTLQPERTNRTNQHWSLRITQADAVVSTGTAVFGVRRSTWTDTECAPPSAPPPDEVSPGEFPDFIAWGRNYNKRFVVGGIDEPATDDSTTTMWLRDEPARPIDYPSLAAMSDAFFPRVFLRRGTAMAAGTISLTIYFHATSAELQAHGERHVLATARGARFAHGHFDQYGQLWGDDLLATTHQLVYYKDPT